MKKSKGILIVALIICVMLLIFFVSISMIKNKEVKENNLGKVEENLTNITNPLIQNNDKEYNFYTTNIGDDVTIDRICSVDGDEIKLIYKRNNKKIWTYETAVGTAWEVDSVEHIEIKDKKIYINEDGTITTLDIETGKVLWKNPDYKGSGSVHCFDKYGTLYIIGKYSPLCIIDSNGKTIKSGITHELLDGENWNMYIKNDNKLAIGCLSGNVLVDLEDYSVSLEK